MNKIPADIWAEKWENKVQEHCRRRKNINQKDVISPRQAKVLAKVLSGLEKKHIAHYSTGDLNPQHVLENGKVYGWNECVDHIKKELKVSDES